MRAAVAQINTVVGDLRFNRNKILDAMDLARSHKADLVVFPELTITGYPPEDLLFKKKFIDDNLAAVRSLAIHSRGLTALVGFVDRDSHGRLGNALGILDNGRWAGTYHKIDLPNYGVFDEKRYFTPGWNAGILAGQGFSAGLSICEDVWSPGPIFFNAWKTEEIAFLVNVSASPYHIGKQRLRERLLSALAKKISAPILYVNLVGGQDELVFDGGGVVCIVSP